MIQDILTAITIGAASAYTIFSFAKVVMDAKQKKSGCSGCSACAPDKQRVYKLDKKFPQFR